MKALVVQKGAREHYAVAQSLHQRGMLAGLITDWYAFDGNSKREKFNVSRSLSRFFGRRGRAAMAARCEAIPDELVQALPLRSLLWKWREHRSLAQGSPFDTYAQIDRAFAKSVTRLKLPPHDVFFGFSYASLELLQFEKEQGAFTVLDQIDPGPAHYRLVAEEMTRHPELAGLPAAFPKDHFDRARQEWNLADMIVVNSDWTREAIISEGASPEKIEVIPLCYEQKAGDQKPKTKNRKPGQPLRVLFLGQVSVGKGIHSLIEAARQLANERVEFLIAGQLSIRNEVVAKAPANIRWLGVVPRSQVSELYRQSDVFVLPTLSDGFAITQLEAMAHGLPVIATPNCGRVVTGGRTGFVVPPKDPQALAGAIMRFVNDPAMAQGMYSHCLETVAKFSVQGYGIGLIQAINQHREGN
jgi:glycosyltransferase involved in cell wall biosynthesis